MFPVRCTKDQKKKDGKIKIYCWQRVDIGGNFDFGMTITKTYKIFLKKNNFWGPMWTQDWSPAFFWPRGGPWKNTQAEKCLQTSQRA